MRAKGLPLREVEEAAAGAVAEIQRPAQANPKKSEQSALEPRSSKPVFSKIPLRGCFLVLFTGLASFWHFGGCHSR